MTEAAELQTKPSVVEAPPRGLPPGPPPASFLGGRGNALRFFRNPVAYLVDLRERYGEVACLIDTNHSRIFAFPADEPTRTIFGFGPRCNKQILSQPEIFQTRRPQGPKAAVAERLSRNILFMNGDEHKQRRRRFNPAFTRDHLKTYHNDMVEYAERMARGWKPGQQIDGIAEMHKLTRDIATRALFGLEPTESEDSLSLAIRRVISKMFSPTTLIPIDLPGTPLRRLRLEMEKLERMLKEEIERKRADRGKGDDVLTMIIAAHDDDGKPMDTTELIAQSFVLFFAGHDTASSGLAWTLFLLAQHPEVMAELEAEFEENLGGRPPTYEEIYSLPVLDRVVKESLRLLCPAVVFPRVAVEDTELCGFAVPAGSEVLYSSYITHLDPEIYPQPRRFKPDRWIDFNPGNYDYLPFGEGPRKCLGSSFGSMQMRVILAVLLQRHRLEMVPGARVDINVNVVMAPKALPMVVRGLGDAVGERVEVGGFVREMVDFG